MILEIDVLKIEENLKLDKFCENKKKVDNAGLFPLGGLCSFKVKC